jgi:outer membrane biosynthesis protein TonB
MNFSDPKPAIPPAKALHHRTLFAAPALLLAAALATPSAHAQGPCRLTHLKEHAPEYPLGQESHPIGGTVQVLATFTPQGRVSTSEVIDGPQVLRFEAEAYVRGWRVDPADDERQCLITLDYRFDSSSRACSTAHQPSIRPQHVDDTHVIMHITCDFF